MTQEIFQELLDRAAAIGQSDVHLGRLLADVILHLGKLQGLEPKQPEVAAEEPAPAQEEETAPLQEAPAQEDAQAKEGK